LDGYAIWHRERGAYEVEDTVDDLVTGGRAPPPLGAASCPP
jgi:hypothetical protein